MPASHDIAASFGETVTEEPIDTNRSVRVEVLPHPFSAHRETHHLVPNGSIRELLTEIGLATKPARSYAICIDGVPIAEDQYEWLAPLANEVVTIRSLARGGDDKNIGLIIVGVILIAAAIYFQQPWLASFGFSLLTAGVAGLIAPAPPKLNENKGNADPLVSTITGSRNVANPFGAIPRILGYHKIYPPYGALPYTEVFDNEQYIRLLFVNGYGPLEITDIKIGETPIAEYSDVDYDVFEGRPADGAPAYYTKSVDEDTFDILLPNGVPGAWNVRTTSADTIEIIVDVVFPLGLLWIRDDGDRKNANVAIEIQYKQASAGEGAYITFENFVVIGRTSSLVRRSSRKTGLGKDQYDVRVRRANVAPNNNTNDEARWTVLRSVTFTAGGSPVDTTKNLSMISMRIRATNQLNGVIDELNVMAKSYLQTYNGATWVEAKSNNPAWCFASVLTDAANEKAVSTARLDADGLKSWGDWCTSNGFYFNKSIAEKTTVFALLKEIASAGRASFYMKDDLYSVIRDIGQSVPIQHITPRNSWNYAGTKIFNEGIHAARVSFINEQNEFLQDERLVYADGYSLPNATKIEALAFGGVTDPEQVFKLARYHIAQLLLRPEVHTVMMDIENLVCSRGDLVAMVHDVPKFGLGQARITVLNMSGSDMTGVDFDDVFTMESPPEIYAVRMRKKDGVSLLVNIDTAVGDNYSVVFSSAILSGNPMPEVGDIIMFAEQVSSTVPMIVKAIEPAADLTASVSFVDAAPGVLTAADGTIPDYDPHITQPSVTTRLNPPTPEIVSIVSNESLMSRRSDGSLITRLGVGLFVPGNTRLVADYFFQLQWRINGTSNPWLSSPLVPADQGMVIVDQVDDGTQYEIRARTTNGQSRHSPWTVPVAHTIVGKTSLPPDVTTLFVNVQADGTREFVWTLDNPPPDLDGFVMKFKAGGSGTWANSAVLHTSVIKASPFETNQLASGQYTFLIKAVDVAGNESQTAKAVISTIGDPRLGGALIQINCQALGWPDVKTDCTVDQNTLYLEANGTKTWADFATDAIEWVDWTAGFNRVPENPIQYEHGGVDVGAIVSFTPLVTFQGRGTPTITEAHSDTDSGYSSFTAITGPITARWFKIRVSLADTEPLFENLIIIADAKAQTEDLIDVDMTTLTGSTGDRTLNLNKSFNVITSVAIALQNVGAGWSTEIINKNSTGPNIKVYNGSDVLSDATIDVVIRGIA